MDRLNFEITDNFDIYVSQKSEDTGITSKKPISVDTLYSILNEVVISSKKESMSDEKGRRILYSSPILPSYHGVHVAQHIIKDKEVEYYVLQREKRPAKFAFYDDVFDNIGLPGMIFVFSLVNKVIRNLRVFAIKDRLLKEDTDLYAYPFPNVSSNGSVCLGSNNMSDYKIENINNLHSFPSMFFMMPATHELRNQNSSGLKVRPLLNELKDNDFNDDYLIKTNMKYGDFITREIG